MPSESSELCLYFVLLQEAELIDDPLFSFVSDCVECKELHVGECSLHGPLTWIKDTPSPKELCSHSPSSIATEDQDSNCRESTNQVDKDESSVGVMPERFGEPESMPEGLESSTVPGSSISNVVSGNKPAISPTPARWSFPAGVEARKSNIPNAGWGAFAVKSFDARVVFGPYRGRKRQLDEILPTMNQSYMWDVSCFWQNLQCTHLFSLILP